MISSFIKTIFKFATSTAIVAITLALVVQRYFISPRLDSDRPKRPFHEPPDFDQCNRLQELLTQIQHHILESITTQQCYAAICKYIKHELQDGTLSVNVSVDDIKAHFSSTWPTFVPMNPRFMRYKDELRWGRVGKGHDDGNEIELDPDLVRVVEAAPEVRFQPPSFRFLRI